MNLREYEQLKFELAGVIRSAQLLDRGKDENDEWRDLLTRLAEDRFTVVVVGRFSRGKSSLMNAVLGLERLPTGVVPVTSVITFVRYGTSERIVLRYHGSRLGDEAKLQDLAEYITERSNPGNVKGLRSVEIQLPVDILRRGFFFVDTPGLGSAILENTETTRRFIPEIDMLILVTGFESPLSEDELGFLQRASGSVRSVFIVVNKHDLVPPEARKEVLEYVVTKSRAVLGARALRVFSVSARDGIRAKQAGDVEALQRSGAPELESELVHLLSHDRALLFLSAMCDRMQRAVDSLGEEGTEIRTTLKSIAERLSPASVESDAMAVSRDAGSRESEREVATVSRYPGECRVCAAVLEQEFSFLARYQFEVSTRPAVREEHAARGGFCPIHTWYYERTTSPRGVCTAYPPLLFRTANILRSWSTDEGWARHVEPGGLGAHCPLCEYRRSTEDTVVASVASRAASDRQPTQRLALCVPHLLAVLARVGSTQIRQQLLHREAAWLERIAEDMQRYAVKQDGLRRDLTSNEEVNAPFHALQILAGHREV
jgi:GTP-binding protein EngB required for normal cell division